MKKKKKALGKPLSKRMEENEQKRKSQILGFLLGPYMLSEMHGRPPKIPPSYPSPEQIQRLTPQGMSKLKTILITFMRQTGGPDLTEEERKNFNELARLNPKVKVSTPEPDSSPQPT